jgi:hypothetical protein
VTATVFLGLVTHERSRFQDSSGPDGLVSRLSRDLGELGVSTTLRISDKDACTPDLITLDRDEVLKSIGAELAVEREWRRYLQPEHSAIGLSAFMLARRAYRTFRFAPPWRPRLDDDDPGIRMVRRLVNIELSHVALLHQAVETESTWALIVEDDASADDVAALAQDLEAFIDHYGSAAQPKYVNVSESFGQERLNTEHHLQPVGTWHAGAPPTELLSANRPVTNTVCAILYRTTFLRELLPFMDAIPVSPVLPIDWKLNRALLTMFNAGRIGPGDCWMISPAPLLQRSMHQS